VGNFVMARSAGSAATTQSISLDRHGRRGQPRDDNNLAHYPLGGARQLREIRGIQGSEGFWRTARRQPAFSSAGDLARIGALRPGFAARSISFMRARSLKTRRGDQSVFGLGRSTHRCGFSAEFFVGSPRKNSLLALLECRVSPSLQNPGVRWTAGPRRRKLGRDADPRIVRPFPHARTR
jgi:hypothetical protein